VDRDGQDYQHLVNYMEESTCFTDPRLQLSQLATQTGIPARRLSALINQKAGLNFNQFINRYRVGRAQQLLLDAEYSHFNMHGIANEAGFQSKTSFYNAFKTFAQMTPQQFRQSTGASALRGTGN
jgi:AraC-like DNA-binding protein